MVFNFYKKKKKRTVKTPNNKNLFAEEFIFISETVVKTPNNKNLVAEEFSFETVFFL